MQRNLITTLGLFITLCCYGAAAREQSQIGTPDPSTGEIDLWA